MTDYQVPSLSNYERQLKSEWENYMTLGGQEMSVRKPIANSWRRCTDFGVSAQLPNVHVGERVNHFLRDHNSQLDYAVEPFFPQLKRLAEESNHILVLADATGTVVHVDGAYSVRRDFAERLKCVVGARWSEQDAGTNALGTALATGEPIQVFGAEHYCESVHGWTCSAAPIVDSIRRSILGVIDLTGQVQHYHPHSLVAVIAIARSIEERLRNRQMYDYFHLFEAYSNCQISSRVDVLAIDADFAVIKFSSDEIHLIWNKHGRVEVQHLLKTGLAPDAACSFQLETPQQIYKCVLRPVVNEGRTLGALFYYESALSARIHTPSGSLRYSFSDILGESSAMRRTIQMARQSAMCDLPVLIEGETGTGKELFAQSIHRASSRSKGPFVAVNCSAIPRELAVSELLGFVGGAFTGANKDGNPGKFERAANGTLFLDEVEDMPLEAQAALLRVLEEKEVTRVGGYKPIHVDVRVIAATNRSLLDVVADGKFREDLYYRLNVLSFSIPPLRERVEDIPTLIRFFSTRAIDELKCPSFTFSERTMENFKQHLWPGNIRELKNRVYRMVIQRQDNLMDFITPNQSSGQDRPINNPLKNVRKDNVEAILKMLEKTGGNVSETARRLGMNRSTVYRKLISLQS